MNTNKLSLKLYAKPDTVPESVKLTSVLHDFIKDSVLPELMIDVVDYGHVHHGPAVLFVGHESDYALDFGEGRAGLLYVRKRPPDIDPAQRLDDSVRRLLEMAAHLESRLAPLSFNRNELLLRVMDRLNVPNDEATYDKEKGSILAGVRRLFGDSCTLVREGSDPREPLTVRVSAR